MSAFTTTTTVFTGGTARAVRRTVTTVVFVIASLAFAFGFGNGWALGLQLGVPGWIAPLVAPAVDLSVIALLATVQFLRAHGLGGRLTGPRLLLVTCGLITFALNTARPIIAGEVGRACFDAIAPLLLIGWSEVGPRLLALLHSAVPDGPIYGSTFKPSTIETTPYEPLTRMTTDAKTAVAEPSGIVQDDSGTVPDGPNLAPELVARAREADTEHQKRHGRRITRDALRTRLRVSNAVAGELLRELRAPPPEAEP